MTGGYHQKCWESSYSRKRLMQIHHHPLPWWCWNCWNMKPPQKFQKFIQVLKSRKQFVWTGMKMFFESWFIITIASVLVLRKNAQHLACQELLLLNLFLLYAWDDKPQMCAVTERPRFLCFLVNMVNFFKTFWNHRCPFPIGWLINRGVSLPL